MIGVLNWLFLLVTDYWHGPVGDFVHRAFSFSASVENGDWIVFLLALIVFFSVVCVVGEVAKVHFSINDLMYRSSMSLSVLGLMIWICWKFEATGIQLVVCSILSVLVYVSATSQHSVCDKIQDS